MTERNRGRVHLNERRGLRVDFAARALGSWDAILDDYELPPAPENPDFIELHTPAQADAIEKRFRNGFELREIYDARAARLAREASIACHKRFNKPKRPKRKELRVKLGDVAHRPGSR